MPNRVLKASTELASIAAWGSAFQTSITHWEKTCFLMLVLVVCQFIFKIHLASLTSEVAVFLAILY